MSTHAVERNKRILVIPDCHFPYAHPDAIKFLSALKEKYKPTRVIHLGDEIDAHAISFHEVSPDLPSPGHELKLAIEHMRPLYRIFPELDIMESNHGSRVYRKGKAAGLPEMVFRSYGEILDAPKGWRWHRDLQLKLPNGQRVMFFHGKGSQCPGPVKAHRHEHSERTLSHDVRHQPLVGRWIQSLRYGLRMLD